MMCLFKKKKTADDFRAEALLQEEKEKEAEARRRNHLRHAVEQVLGKGKKK